MVSFRHVDSFHGLRVVELDEGSVIRRFLIKTNEDLVWERVMVKTAKNRKWAKCYWLHQDSQAVQVKSELERHELNQTKEGSEHVKQRILRL